MSIPKLLIPATIVLAGVITGAVLLRNQPQTPARASQPPAPAHNAPPAITASSPAVVGVTSPDSPPPAPAARQRRHAIEDRGSELAAADPSRALSELVKLSDPSDRAVFLRGIFEALARGERRTALALACGIREAPERNLALATLLDAWSGTPGLSLQSVTAPPGGLAGVMGRWLLDPAHADPVLAVEIANDLLDADQRVDLLAAAASAHAAADPRAAFLFGESLGGKDQDRFIHAFASGWAAKDPKAAAAWAADLDDPAFRDQVLAGVLTSAASKSAPEAAAILSEIRAPGLRTQSINAIAGQWAAQDTAAALQWAGALPEQERQGALNAIRQVAPVGVGLALIAKDGGSYPSIAEIVPGGPASRTAALQPTDQIVAFTNETGQWVNTTGMTLDQVVQHIRGSPGTGIQLRLLGASDSDPARARTVAITREQILRRN